MGLDYSYLVYVRPTNVPRALAALADLAPETHRAPPLTVTLPGGDQVTVPFTSRFRSDPVDWSTDEHPAQLDTTFLVDADDHVREYLDVDESGRALLGYVYLSVDYRSVADWVELKFMAATSGMSQLFEESGVVRSLFTDLTAASGGACCLLDTETDHDQVCWLNGSPVRETVPGPRFPTFQDLVATW